MSADNYIGFNFTIFSFIFIASKYHENNFNINCRSMNFKSRLSLINVYISEAIKKKRRKKSLQANKKRYVILLNDEI